MQARLECDVCLLRQTLEAMCGAGVDEAGRPRIIHKAMGEMSQFGPGLTPPERVYRIPLVLKQAGDETKAYATP